MVKAAIVGAVSGYLLAVAFQCSVNLYRGGTWDPRCVQAWHGWVQVHDLAVNADTVSCQYRPEIEALQPGSPES